MLKKSKKNSVLTQKLKESEEKVKKRESKKNKEQPREQFIVIEMETNDEEEDMEQLVRNKENRYTRSNPQSEPLKKKKDIYMYDCPGCDKKINKREHMLCHQKTHEVSCLLCGKMLKTVRK